MPDGNSPRPVGLQPVSIQIDAGTLCLERSETPTAVGYPTPPTAPSPVPAGPAPPVPLAGSATSPAADDAKKIAASVAALKTACDEAYNDSDASKSCSHAVWYVLKKLIDPKTEFRDANGLIDHMASSTDWRKVDLDAGWDLANKGIVVVGGKKETGHGHVIVIYPGDKTLGGGYKYKYKDRKTSEMKETTMKGHGPYPRCLSTSIGSWPGAVSDGDKSVWDPWANDESFKLVGFWTMDKP